MSKQIEALLITAVQVSISMIGAVISGGGFESFMSSIAVLCLWELHVIRLKNEK